MDSLNYEAHQKMFIARRLHPWIPEHDLFIRGEIAKLEVTDPTAASSYGSFYGESMQKYIEENMPVEESVPSVEVPVVTETEAAPVVIMEAETPSSVEEKEETKEVIETVAVVEEKPKKKKKKESSSLSSTPL